MVCVLTFPRHRPTVGCQEEAVSCERGIPVRVSLSLDMTCILALPLSLCSHPFSPVTTLGPYALDYSRVLLISSLPCSGVPR